MNRSRKRFLALLVLAGIVLTLIAARALLPTWVESVINQELADMGNYRGQLQSVELNLWRGAYRIHHLEIRKREEVGADFVPFLTTPVIDLSISWRDLLKPALVGRIEFYSPELNFVDSEQESDDQTGEGVNWRQTLQRLLPIKLNEVVVHNGKIHFRNFQTEPNVDIYVDELEAVATNLTNADREEGAQVAEIDAEGKLLGEVPVEASMDFDPLGEMNNFEFNFRAQDIALPDLNPLLKAYAKIDAESGRVDFVMQLKAEQAVIDGYAKVLVQNFSFVSWEQDVEENQDNPFVLAWEGITEAVSKIFSNQSKDQFAIRVPIEGNLEEPEGSTLPAIGSIVYNAFVEALSAHFEGAESEP